MAYLNISSFGGNIGEINGLTHPDWRRKGLFKRLFDLAQIEGRNRNFSKLLLLSDGKSNPGIEFIKSVGGRYDISEYHEVALDVACTNNSALNLYLSCGFVQQSVMDYYQYS